MCSYSCLYLIVKSTISITITIYTGVRVAGCPRLIEALLVEPVSESSLESLSDISCSE